MKREVPSSLSPLDPVLLKGVLRRDSDAEL